MLKVLNSLEATSKRTVKESILTNLSHDEAELFKKIGIATYSPGITYNIVKYPRPTVYTGLNTLEAAIDGLKVLSSRSLTGKKAIEYMTRLEGSLSADDGEVLFRIVKKDLRCGVTDSTMNKVWPDLIYTAPYQRCSSFSKKNLSKLKLPAFSQTKSDGMYVDIIANPTTVVYRSRTCEVKPFNNQETDGMFIPGFVYMGEALYLDENGKIMSRKDGNGRLNADEVDTSRIVFVLWDIVPLADYEARICKIPYATRLNTLKTAIAGKADHLRLVSTKVVNSVQEIIDHFKEEVEKGEEGTVVKNQHGIWADHTSPDQVKCKIEFECDLEIIRLEEGTGKNAGRLGAAVCASAERMLITGVGTGFSDKDRDALWNENTVGMIITVRANDIVKDRNSETFALFLPRNIEVRTDKTVADTYERIVEQMNAFVDTLEAIGK
jgi:DNA ligase-1